MRNYDSANIRRTPHCLRSPRVHFRTHFSIFLVRSHHYMNEVATYSHALDYIVLSLEVSIGFPVLFCQLDVDAAKRRGLFSHANVSG